MVRFVEKAVTVPGILQVLRRVGRVRGKTRPVQTELVGDQGEISVSRVAGHKARGDREKETCRSVSDP